MLGTAVKQFPLHANIDHPQTLENLITVFLILIAAINSNLWQISGFNTLSLLFQGLYLLREHY